MNSKGNFMKSVDESLRSKIHLLSGGQSPEEKLQPGHLVILDHATWEMAERVNNELGIDSGKDAFVDVSMVDSYVVYMDRANIVHQMYSFVPMAWEEVDGADYELPEFITSWVDRAEANAGMVLSKGGKDDINDLEKLVSQQCKSFTFKHDALTYYDKKKKPSGVNIYTVTYKFYAVHSIDSNTDYYYVNCDGVFSFGNQYVKPYHESVGGALSKVEEYYGKYVEIECCVGDNMKGVKHNIMLASPGTTQHTSSITTGMSWNLGGAVSYNFGKGGGATAEINGGIEVSNSSTIDVQDVTVRNKCNESDQAAKWRFEFRETDCSFSFFSYGQVSLKECSLTAQNTFVPDCEWIWRFESDKNRQSRAQFKVRCDVGLQSSRARLINPGKTGCYEKTSETGLNQTKGQVLTVEIKKPPVSGK